MRMHARMIEGTCVSAIQTVLLGRASVALRKRTFEVGRFLLVQLKQSSQLGSKHALKECRVARVDSYRETLYQFHSPCWNDLFGHALCVVCVAGRPRGLVDGQESGGIHTAIVYLVRMMAPSFLDCK